MSAAVEYDAPLDCYLSWRDAIAALKERYDLAAKGRTAQETEPASDGGPLINQVWLW